MMRCLKLLRHPETARDFMEIHLRCRYASFATCGAKDPAGDFIEKICEPII